MANMYVYRPLKQHDSIRIIELQPAASWEMDLECEILECRLEQKVRIAGAKKSKIAEAALELLPSGRFSEARTERFTYEAISYAWGDPIFSETLKTSQGILMITKSLAGALRRFRPKTETRRLWADAVCIDQTNDDERGHQVHQMGLIYQNATGVLAWLGEGTDSARQGMIDCGSFYPVSEKYHVVEKDVDYEVFSGPHLKSTNASGKEENLTTWDLGWERVRTKDNEDSMRTVLKDMKASKLEDLVALPWFSRLWVIQEVACSTTTKLYCGDCSLDWKVFATVMRLLVAITNLQGPLGVADLEEEDVILTPNFKRAWNIVHLRTEYRATSIGGLFCISTYRQFGGSLSRARAHDCADDRDRIFALLSLISEGAKERGIEVEPDYSKTAPEIYREFALKYLLTPASVEFPRDARILSDAGLWQRSPESWENTSQMGYMNAEYLPSWVPEYRTRNLGYDELPWTETKFNTSWHTCPPGIHEMRATDFALPDSFVEHRNVLGVSGTVVDKIATMIVTDDKATALRTQASRNSLDTNAYSVDRIVSMMIPGDQTTSPGTYASERLYSGLASLSESSGWTNVRDCLSVVRFISEDLMRNGKYFTGEDIRAALVRTLLAECSHPVISKMLWDYPNTKDEARMIALWNTVEETCFNPQGELSRVLQEMEARDRQAPEGKRTDWPTELRKPRDDGQPRWTAKGLEAMEFMTAVQWVLSRCKLIFSTYGLLALVPKAAQKYDTIVKFQGTKMPFVIRPTGFGGLNWLVGPCYVHGIMHCPSVDHDIKIMDRGGVIGLI